MISRNHVKSQIEDGLSVILMFLKMIKKLQILLLTALVVVLVSACGTTAEIPTSIPTQAVEEKVSEMTQAGFDPTYIEKKGVDVIYLAGGCFWGLEKLMQSLPGVVSAVRAMLTGMQTLNQPIIR